MRLLRIYVPKEDTIADHLTLSQSNFTQSNCTLRESTELTPDADTSPLLDDAHKHRIQEIVGALLYYARAVDNKLLVALSAIAARQTKATVAMEQAVHLLLDYVATYPNDGIV